VVTNHWVASSFDNVGWTVGTTLPNRDIVIPAGATLKRFVVSQTRMQGTTNGIGLGAVGNFDLVQTVSIISGPYAGHTLWASRRAIASQFVGLYDVAVANRVYSELINAGDNEFLINERTAFGTRTGAAFTVRYASGVSGGIGFTGLISNASASANFRVLYETSP
jgi:hypothetical protein